MAAKPVGTDIDVEAQAAVWPRSDRPCSKIVRPVLGTWGSLPRYHHYCFMRSSIGECTGERLLRVPTVRQ